MFDILGFLVLTYPEIDPIIFEIGPLAVRWYGLAYVAGLLIGWWYFIRLNEKAGAPMSRREIDDLLLWVALGVVVGGRLGYVLFYKPLYYLYNPLDVLAVWDGGMSFHGGLLGVTLALFWFARHHSIGLFRLGDLIAVVAPIGLFFGRLANFVNAELWGRVTDVPWAMVFPGGGPAPRHPSQLYEAGLEGMALFLILATVFHLTRAREKPGLIAGLFWLGYGVFRAFVELFREPDAHLGFLYSGLTMGQLLSVPMMVLGGYLLWRALIRARQ